MNGRRRSIVAAAVAAFAASSAGPAVADARLAVPCPNGVPCSMEVSGHVDTVGTARLPWTASVVAPADVCLIVNKISSDGPVVFNVVTPDGKQALTVKGRYIAVSPTVAGWHTIEVDSPAPVGEQLFSATIELLSASKCNSFPPK